MHTHTCTHKHTRAYTHTCIHTHMHTHTHLGCPYRQQTAETPKSSYWCSTCGCGKFSQVTTVVVWQSTSSSGPTFENFYLFAANSRSVAWRSKSLEEILKYQLAAQIYYVKRLRWCFLRIFHSRSRFLAKFFLTFDFWLLTFDFDFWLLTFDTLSHAYTHAHTQFSNVSSQLNLLSINEWHVSQI